MKIVETEREQFLRTQETRLRNRAITDDSAMSLKLIEIILAVEDAEAIHENAALRWMDKGNRKMAEIHERHRDNMIQIRLFALDQLEINLKK